MLVLVRFTLFFMMISSLLIYLFTNIKLIGEGSPALSVLVFSVLLGGLIVLEILLNQNVYIKKSFLVLILFFIYLVVWFQLIYFISKRKY